MNKLKQQDVDTTLRRKNKILQFKSFEILRIFLKDRHGITDTIHYNQVHGKLFRISKEDGIYYYDYLF